MSLAAGTKLGAYEVVAPLGAGGMGEVYQAHDTTLDREVAVKVVHSRLCDQPDSVARLRREARALAALNHPHVATIHEFGEYEGVCFVVMELVPGETLSEYLAHHPLTLGATLRVFDQIAAAIEAAHQKGLVHRDLKPANIKITADGIAKVLDFGLAKALSVEDPGDALSRIETVGTQPGMVVGTTAYMSPEQARGHPVDGRTDIWAFGCVLFEALTRRRAFAGETTSDTIGRILEREPDWNLLPAETPDSIRRLLRRCLEKDWHKRLRDIGDARLEIADASSESTPHAAVTNRRLPARWSYLAGAVLLGGMAGAVLVAALRTPPPAPVRPLAHVAIPLPPGEQLAGLDFPAVAIAPDGTRLVYVAERGGRTQLFVRPLSALGGSPIPGTTDALAPFFSPDSQWIAFFAQGKLKKVPVQGGPAVTICDANIGFGGSWGIGDTIVFAPATGTALSQVSAAGGPPSRVTTLDTDRGEFSHRWPHLLPDGKTVLFTVGTLGSWDDAEIVAQSLTTGERHSLIKGGSHPQYLPTGHLLYARAGAMMAVAFDPERLTVAGSPIRVLDTVQASFDGAAQLSVSRAGTVVYVPGVSQGSTRRLIGVDRVGSVAPFAAPPRAYTSPRVSPDGRQVLITITNATDDVWMYDVTAGTLRQLTFEADNSAPIWTPDGQRVTFSSNRAGALNLFGARVDGSGAPERLSPSDNIQLAGSWSPDGAVLAFVEQHPTTGRDILLLRRSGNPPVQSFLATPFHESSPRFSPDGRWIAYVSNESGRSEVYVRPSANPAQKSQISINGGLEPVWGRDGRELFYRADDQLLSVPVESASAFRAGQPRILFKGIFEGGTVDRPNFDTGAGGQTFVMIKSDEQQEGDRELHLLLNWLENVPTLVTHPPG